ncbi:MAG: hypothetical protein E3J35_06575 [Methanomassiliicoccales archaeon]|nr:MAG: hypothetical protein E3J35_06575 [Methanomassiliicoccales archaeon]
MNKRRLVSYSLRGLLLFLISAGVMALFWYHDLLYQYGLLALAVFGGLGIAVMISLLSWLTRSHRSVMRRSKNSIFFAPEDVTKVMYGTISSTAIPLDEVKPPPVGSYCAARVRGNRKTAFATLAVKNAQRKIAEDLDDSDLAKLGFRDLERFLDNPKNNGRAMSAEDGVHLVEFEVQEKRRL